MENRTTKRYLTDADRDNILKLLVCGLGTTEIVEIMHVSRSTVCYVKQAHTAALDNDWSTLQRLSNTCEAVVKWAMKVTGADKTFEELFVNELEPVVEETTPTVEEPASAPVVTEPVVTREDFFAMYGTMQDIRSLLIEIRDMLK